MFGTQGVLAFSKVPALGNVGGMMKKATFCCMYLLDPLLIWVVQFEGWNRSSWSKGALMLRMSLCCCSARKWSLGGILVKIIQKYFHLKLIPEYKLKCSWKVMVSSARVQLGFISSFGQTSSSKSVMFLTLLGLGLIKINTLLANFNNPRPSLILSN